MTKRRGLVLVVVFVVLAFVGYACYERFPWIDAAAYAHSQRGSANCGHIVEPDYQGAQAAINCATSAHQQRRPFVVIFSVHGIDEQISNAIVGDSKANALEIMYATGMVTNANMLLRHRCNVPVQLQIQEATPIAFLDYTVRRGPPLSSRKTIFFGKSCPTDWAVMLDC